VPGTILVYSSSVYGLYSVLLLLALVFYTPGHFIRMRLLKKQSLFLKNRLGLKLPEAKAEAPSLWIHAVSVGEVLSLRRLVSELRARHPDWPVYFSTLTHTGYEVAKKALPEAEEIFFVPLDFGRLVRRFFDALKPQMFILAESEFWPHLLRQARRRCRSVILINGRISGRSFKRYRRWRRIILPVLGNVDYFLVQTEKDLARLEGIGIPRKKLEVAGNLKVDVQLPPVSGEEKVRMKAGFGLSPGRRVIVAGSTHRGEEAVILEAFAAARTDAPDTVLVLAPRHPERSAEVEKAAEAAGLSTMRMTESNPNKPWQVLILDTIGELAKFYALADLAFIGGSLVAHGGQNLLEPAYYGTPTCFGPHMENFADLADLFARSGAARVVLGREQLEEAFRMGDKKGLEEMGRKARQVLNSIQGATGRTVAVIESMMTQEGAAHGPAGFPG
jgi:3-deoxy-D-manno-octulosonic-acid transferase